MADESFILVSLKDAESKKLANVISNETSRKILDYLSGKKYATESDLAKEMSLPISTIHYNLKQLVHSGLVKTEEYHYSEKGKEVNHYSLSNKFVIIAPQTGEKILSKLKKLLPIAIITAGIAAVMQFVLFTRAGTFSAKNGVMLAENARAADTAAAGSIGTAPAPLVQSNALNIPSYAPSIALWFFIGAMSALAIYFVYDVVREKKKR